MLICRKVTQFRLRLRDNYPSTHAIKQNWVCTTVGTYMPHKFSTHYGREHNRTGVKM